METGFRYRDALRLLFILHMGARTPEPTEAPPGVIGIFEGEKRLMAIDFWVRYPDYLADQLLNAYEKSKDANLISEIQKIFDRDEPDVRTIKVLRWRYGAFDRIEDALAILSARNLVKPMKKSIPTGIQHDFLIYQRAAGFLRDAVQEQPTIKWYEDRTHLALSVAGDKSGSALKDMQYAVPEYDGTQWSAEIPGIKDRVLRRLKDLTGA
ncbi:hypothetical protein CVM73_22090 [Bradyrhizobium forestalis]|uniref:Uncharacterized protein n=1 Tax=Bradyrhizobium forestalis TaxID=1419263 RepID=A0A2M8R5S0_9BRAD|nr:hypothetical protein [Bradyrhizobium forestalis]PJG53161.1 hypothetical protein CVM73_22090 [Bradyrhizobium forestalis]